MRCGSCPLKLAVSPCIIRMDDISRYVPRDGGQVHEDLRDLYRPSIASRMEEKLDELWGDPQFFAEVKERFEKGRLRGNYPALERYLGQLSEEQRDMALVVGGHGSAIQSFVPREVEPWDRTPFDSVPGPRPRDRRPRRARCPSGSLLRCRCRAGRSGRRSGCLASRWARRCNTL